MITHNYFEDGTKKLKAKWAHLFEYQKNELNQIRYAFQRHFTVHHCRHCNAPIRNIGNPVDKKLMEDRGLDPMTYGPKYDWKWKSNYMGVFYTCHECWKNSDQVYYWGNIDDQKIVYDYYRELKASYLDQLFEEI